MVPRIVSYLSGVTITTDISAAWPGPIGCGSLSMAIRGLRWVDRVYLGGLSNCRDQLHTRIGVTPGLVHKESEKDDPDHHVQGGEYPGQGEGGIEPAKAWRIEQTGRSKHGE